MILYVCVRCSLHLPSGAEPNPLDSLRRVRHHYNVKFCSYCRNFAAQSDCSVVQVLKAWLINECSCNSRHNPAFSGTLLVS